MRRTALVIGSGPNGLAAALVLAQAGWEVEVREASDRLGGAASSAPLTLPGFVHDVGSAVHPFAVASPFFSSLPLQVRWIYPAVPLAHPLDDGTAVLLHQDLKQTASGLGRDRAAWEDVFGLLVRHWEIYRHELLHPLGPTKHPVLMFRLGLQAIRSASALAHTKFQGTRARTLFAGLAAHYPFIDQPLSAGIALALGAAGQATGWPIPQGGAQSITDDLVRQLQLAGGRAVTSSLVENLAGEDRLIMADTSPHRLSAIAAQHLPEPFRRSLQRFRYGPGAFKMDWALSQPIPWKARECALAGTVHIGGAADEIFASERAATQGLITEQPFVLLSQPTLFDSSRAPAGMHIAWAYCHTPANSPDGRAEQIERQIERFAPGFRDCILARHVAGPQVLQRENANLVGGDVAGGIANLMQTVMRPTWRRYTTPNPRIFLCSSSTPPGAGVHGMCGFHAARQVLKRFGPT